MTFDPTGISGIQLGLHNVNDLRLCATHHDTFTTYRLEARSDATSYAPDASVLLFNRSGSFTIDTGNLATLQTKHLEALNTDLRGRVAELENLILNFTDDRFGGPTIAQAVADLSSESNRIKEQRAS